MRKVALAFVIMALGPQTTPLLAEGLSSSSSRSTRLLCSAQHVPDQPKVRYEYRQPEHHPYPDVWAIGGTRRSIRTRNATIRIGIINDAYQFEHGPCC